MPPSPSLRRSPGRELEADNHKRGRSLEAGILFKDKEEDLALFNEVQNRERDNFLLQSTDDFEDTFSTKLRYFSDHKLGISVPVRGESSNLLNAEEEKNDYDWLLTPPDTPLFTSLDDEVPPLNLPQRGRLRSQPISISRSSTMEKSRRSSRGSASPNRLSPSPKSSSSVVQTRGRTSSAPHSSPTPSSRHVSPLRRPSPPPGKPSTPTRRSTTPTPRRVSTSSINNTASSGGIRGISPVKSNRGNSASPKVRAWQSNIPGFPSEAPPNLRTSLADRPASYVRGSSPASRNGREFPSKSGRQSMSPTTTRSIGSSHSHDRDRFSSRSKGSLASSGDDDADSLLSIPLGSSEQFSTRRMGSSPNRRAPAFSKKPYRTVASSSAPKRSFDLALRQMDHRKSPQNMFRPLLSSVPSSTLYAGKTSAAQHAITSRNSITTSSNASSDQVTGGEHDTEGSEQNQEDVTSAFVESLEAPRVYTQDEVFDFDKADALNESVTRETQDGSLCSQHADLDGSFTVDCDTGMGTVAALDHDGLEDMLLCQSCGNAYYATDIIDGEINVCQDCRSEMFLTIRNVVTAPTSAGNSPVYSTNILEESGSFGVTDPPVVVPVSAGVTSIAESGTRHHENAIKENPSSYSEPIWDFLSTDSVSGNSVEGGDKRHANPQVAGQPTTYSVPDGGTGDQQMKKSCDYPPVDASGGTGISVLLNRSSSGRGAFLQSRSFTASSNSYDDSSYVRDSAYSLRSSYGHGSLSASSSVDLGLYRQTEARVQRQLSGKQSDLENYRHDMNAKHRRTGSSLSAASNPALQTSSLTPGMLEQSHDASLSQVRNDAIVKLVDAQDQLLSSETMEEDNVYTDGESAYKCRTMDASPSELSTHVLDKHQLSTLTSFSNSEESSSYENGEDLTNNLIIVEAGEASAISLESSVVGEETVSSSSVDMVKGPKFSSQSSLDKISEIETENVHHGSPEMPSDSVSSSSRSSKDELLDPHNTTTSDKEITLLAEPDISNDEHHTLEESTVTVEGKRGSKARSLTLEEATDTILFCSSIVHGMSYDAATIAIEKEHAAPLEGSRPMVTILGKANPERKDAQLRTAVKRTSKPQKTTPRQAESDTKPPSGTNNDENIEVSTNRIVGAYDSDAKSMKAPPKLESKCNCTIM
ncbi:ATP-dependent DNA helicase Q-like 5-like [Heracleum sosnowskyi]|uniref:ATP-dependent DNA helicase Q-like 5-like n=1 Tax=Heracleum sosnowskyi TaxID=360622 RepID=A0AAD8MAJ6_9APIA|nr:ATP-dependent DNA helicase Q-like 5-like [Heracleum sosnowskyi]